VKRSLWELKILFFITFPLLCALRTLERIDTLIMEPITAQNKIFGRVVAYPWQYHDVKSWLDEDGVSTVWSYALPSSPTPLKQCRPGEARNPRGASVGDWMCYLESGDNPQLSAGWEQGRLWVKADPGHIEPAFDGPDAP
jgi:hypothetical protein